MPSVSKKQQKFMGIVRSIQKGEQPAGKFSKAAQDAAKKMKKSSVKKYAKTKHDDLPMKKESYTSNMMKAVRKGGTAGPWDIIISKNNKIVKRVSVKNLKEIPAEMSDVKKKFPNHKIGIESKYGKIVYRESYDFKKAHKKFKETGELPPHLKKISKAKKEFEKKFKVKDIEIPGLEWMSKLGEERDYKAEYKKFQSSTKAKKYRAELNKYNRQKGTYGNGDGKDASHKGGKIVGFEKESTNRGRAEKSRLKKEDVRQEIDEYLDNILEDLCLCEACQKGYMTHPTRKTKIMFGKRYRNCIKKEDVNENEIKKSKINLLKVNAKYTAEEVMDLYKELNNRDVDSELIFQYLDTIKDRVRMMRKNVGLKESVNEAVYKLKRGSTNKDLDELDALLARAGFKGKPDFNKMTWSIKNKNPKIAKIIKSKGGKKIKESVEDWAVNIKLKEGTCGYGIDGKIGEEPAGPNLMKKIKKISKDKEKKKILKSKKEGVNEAGMELKKLEDAIKMFQKKIDKQGRVTNARDEDHLKNLIKIYKQMGGKKIKESVNERLNQSQAKTLLRQLGGNKFIMMTGAKQMSIGKDGLTMKIGRNSKSITHVAIDLDRGKDLYTMKFIRVRKGIPKVVKKYDSIYADNLNNIFEKETGLYTRL